MVENKGQHEDLLWTWKEIAAYLGVDIRTAHRWEHDHDLPVQRIASESDKSRVFAYRSELDRWLKRRGDVPRPTGSLLLRRIASRPIWIVTATAIFCGLAVIIALQFIKGAPADFTIEGSRLIVLDGKGHKLWRFDTGLDNLLQGEHYRDHFQRRRRTAKEDNNLPHIIIRDIDGDDKPETLFTTQTQNEMDEGMLFCFDERGRRLWRFKAGREIRYGTVTHTNMYRILGIGLEDLDRDGHKEVLCIARHRFHAPNQITLLDAASGDVRGEYWHHGHLIDCDFADLDGDGILEILLVGTNNEYNRGVLVVLDPRNIEGGSPQAEPGWPADMPPGSEKFYVLFPVADVEALEAPYHTIETIDDMGGGKLTMRSRWCNIYYTLDYGLAPVSAQQSTLLEIKHRQALDGGLITSRLGGAYLEDLKLQFSYFTGTGWSKPPTMTKIWEESPRQ